jgi:thiamine biosynthesis lipoprotein
VKKKTDETGFLLSREDLLAGVHQFSHEAMATVFEVFIYDLDEKLAQQAAWNAFERVDRLEEELSRFHEGSDIWHINHLKAGDWVKVGEDTLQCLLIAQQIYEQTEGAFDVTIGPLYACWRTDERTNRTPTKEELTAAAQRVGMELLAVSETEYGVGVKVAGVQVDLGAIGKGYAVDQMVELLCEWDVENALLCSGNSTVYALGRLADKDGWPVSLSDPVNPSTTLKIINLRDQAMASSGISEQGEHIIDPGTCQPVKNRLRSWAITDTAAEADALSTAFMILSPEEIEQYCKTHPHTGTMVTYREQDQTHTQKFGRLR